MSTLKVIVSSTRPARIGPKVAQWAVAQAEQSEPTWEIEVVDLSEVDLPFLDEIAQPMSGQYEHAHTLRWKAIIDGADAVLIVTPEYNQGYPATIKNALDTLYPEWAEKPLALLGYGWRGGEASTDGLTRVIGHLKANLIGVVNLYFRQDLSVEGEVSPREEQVAAFARLLSELNTAAAPSAAAHH